MLPRCIGVPSKVIGNALVHPPSSYWFFCFSWFFLYACPRLTLLRSAQAQPPQLGPALPHSVCPGMHCNKSKGCGEIFQCIFGQAVKRNLPHGKQLTIPFPVQNPHIFSYTYTLFFFLLIPHHSYHRALFSITSGETNTCVSKLWAAVLMSCKARSMNSNAWQSTHSRALEKIVHNSTLVDIYLYIRKQYKTGQRQSKTLFYHIETIVVKCNELQNSLGIKVVEPRNAKYSPTPLSGNPLTFPEATHKYIRCLEWCWMSFTWKATDILW